ncbi:MAG: F0F1 ATP synthase subunit B [Deltaproteobacteria bacterium]|nr:F0F1 ATP synthase subunit B [Deltaproteobacteria bacterium]
MNKLIGKRAGKIMLVALVLGLTVAVAGAAEGGGEHHKSLYTLLAEDPMPLLKDFLWRVLNLVVLLWILIKFAGKPVKEYFAGRRESIQKGIEEAREAKAAAEKIYKEYQDKLAGLDDELRQIEEKAQLEAEREKTRMRQETEELVAKLQQQARQMADQEVASAKRQLREEAAQLALEVAEKLVRENVSDDDRKRMVENYLEKVVRA